MTRTILNFGGFLLIGAAAGLGIRLIGGGAEAGSTPAEEAAREPTGSGMRHAADRHDSAPVEMPSTGAPELVVDLGNENCPVMGGKVDGKTFTVWNGLRIGHCCAGCSDPLLEDPENVLDEAGIEWREAAALVEKARAAEGEERERLLAEIGRKWEVVSR